MCATVVFTALHLNSLLVPALVIGLTVAAGALLLGFIGTWAWPGLVVPGWTSPWAVHFRGLPEPPLPPGRGDQRRSLRRKGRPIPVLIRQGNQPSREEVAWVFNRSCGGLGLVFKKPLPPGDEVAIRPEYPQDDLPWVTLKVKHLQPGSRFCVLGCQFLASLPWSTLLLFG
jgi:PilZ domain